MVQAVERRDDTVKEEHAGAPRCPTIAEFVVALSSREPWCLTDDDVSDLLGEKLDTFVDRCAKCHSPISSGIGVPFAIVFAYLPAPVRVRALGEISTNESVFDGLVAVEPDWSGSALAAHHNLFVALEWCARRILQEALYGESRSSRVASALARGSSERRDGRVAR
ncbi:hypothetical protein [Amorphus sp. 3PC139-8]|uniref:hypothetical protein n=1 Tax=Amorphus sp. 3PC139-8 TaxID=2735676 RepID=UPI00345DAED1